MKLKTLFKKESKEREIQWKEFYNRNDQIVPPEKKPIAREPQPPVVKTDSLFQSREPVGPLSQTDQTWKKNLTFLSKEIESAEKRLTFSVDKLEKAREELRNAEVINQDCRKRVYALKEAHAKLQSLVPPEEIVKDEKSPAKKVAKKKTKSKKVTKDE